MKHLFWFVVTFASLLSFCAPTSVDAFLVEESRRENLSDATINLNVEAIEKGKLENTKKLVIRCAVNQKSLIDKRFYIKGIEIYAYDIGSVNVPGRIDIEIHSTSELAQNERNINPIALNAGYSDFGRPPTSEGGLKFVKDEIELSSKRGYLIWVEWKIVIDKSHVERLRSLPIALAID